MGWVFDNEFRTVVVKYVGIHVPGRLRKLEDNVKLCYGWK